MKKALLIHTLWLAVATGAYFVGSRKSETTRQTSSNSPVVVSGSGTLPLMSSGAVKESSRKGGTAENKDKFASFKGADGKISAKSMSDAVQEALRESDPVKATLAFAQLMENLTPENAAAAMKALRDGANGMDNMRFMTMLGYSWGKIDGAGAMKALSENRGGGRDGFARGSVISGWANANPDEAIKFVQAEKAKQAADGNNAQGGRGRGGPGGPGGQGGLERGLVSGLASKDVDQALKYVMGLDEKERGQYSGVLAAEKLKEGIDSAATWAKDLKDPNMKTSALEDVSRQFARTDLDAARDWAAKSAQDPAMKRAVGEVADELSDRNVKDALSFASTLPGGDSQNEAYDQIFRNWTRDDPTEASKALTAMPAGAAKDSAIESFSGALARENPQAALTWAGAIGNVDNRLQTQVEVARRWAFSRDPAQQQAAQQWIQSNLPPAQQQQALQTPQRGDFGPGAAGGGFGGGGGFGRGRGR